ncbi:hypothetical protein QQ020_21675 [Fulvivirgaceae bacterium BMA12]|uniref:Uncharacterized protein n=1 Tax=Agaribacillus aureus TaxID=3051825 RepID=A0ABT8LAK0_9BACT|nr:hypothetical protein [Fulvivirgaceae bacterium BMA12]
MPVIVIKYNFYFLISCASWLLAPQYCLAQDPVDTDFCWRQITDFRALNRQYRELVRGKMADSCFLVKGQELIDSKLHNSQSMQKAINSLIVDLKSTKRVFRDTLMIYTQSKLYPILKQRIDKLKPNSIDISFNKEVRNLLMLLTDVRQLMGSKSDSLYKDLVNRLEGIYGAIQLKSLKYLSTPDSWQTPKEKPYLAKQEIYSLQEKLDQNISKQLKALFATQQDTSFYLAKDEYLKASQWLQASFKVVNIDLYTAQLDTIYADYLQKNFSLKLKPDIDANTMVEVLKIKGAPYDALMKKFPALANHMVLNVQRYFEFLKDSLPSLPFDSVNRVRIGLLEKALINENRQLTNVIKEGIHLYYEHYQTLNALDKKINEAIGSETSAINDWISEMNEIKQKVGAENRRIIDQGIRKANQVIPEIRELHIIIDEKEFLSENQYKNRLHNLIASGKVTHEAVKQRIREIINYE